MDIIYILVRFDKYIIMIVLYIVERREIKNWYIGWDYFY